MLQTDYAELPNFAIPSHVGDDRETIETAFGPVTLYRFDDGNIGLWWRSYGQLHARMMPLIEGRAKWNTGAQAWHIGAEHADAVLADIRSI